VDDDTVVWQNAVTAERKQVSRQDCDADYDDVSVRTGNCPKFRPGMGLSGTPIRALSWTDRSPTVRAVSLFAWDKRTQMRETGVARPELSTAIDEKVATAFRKADPALALDHLLEELGRLQLRVEARLRTHLLSLPRPQPPKAAELLEDVDAASPNARRAAGRLLSSLIEKHSSILETAFLQGTSAGRVRVNFQDPGPWTAWEIDRSELPWPGCSIRVYQRQRNTIISKHYATYARFEADVNAVLLAADGTDFEP